MADPPGWTTGGSDRHTGPPRRDLVVVGLIGLLAVVVVVGGILTLVRDTPPFDDVPVARSEAPSPTPGDSTSTPTPSPLLTPTPTPTTTPIGEPVQLTGLARQVSAIRELPLRRKLRSRLLSEEVLADKISDLAFSEQNPKEVADTERLLVALRLAEPGFDLGGILEDLYREQVLGVYVPEERTLYVRRRGASSPAQQTTTAHEIVHALQDQSFNLAKLQARYEKQADAATAVLALVEGDAVLTQQLWAQEHLSAQEQQQAALDNGGGGEALARAPRYLRDSLFFPYVRGAYFVGDLYREGGFDAVDEALRNPPTSTEQILHPEKFRDRDEPVEVHVQGRPGDGWKKGAIYAFGEFDVRALFGELGSGTAYDVGEGWDGGEVRSWSDGRDTAVGSVLVFDSDEDAEEACEALPAWYAEVAGGREAGDGMYAGDRDHLAVRCGADRVFFGLAPTPQTARRLTAAP